MKKNLFILFVAASFAVIVTSCSKECVCRHNYDGQEWYESLGEMPWYDCGDYEYNMREYAPANHSIKCSTTKFRGKS